MRRILLVAFHFPPSFGSSGSQRTLKFAQYLRDNNWDPIVLTAHPFAYRLTSEKQLAEIPEGLRVCRTFSLDAARHLAIRGRYIQRLAIPDPWTSWRITAIPAGLRLIAKYKPAVVWSTFPIASAHSVGSALHRISGIPWVADFRDVMTEEDYPENPQRRRSHISIEQQTVKLADRVVFTTEGAAKLYAERYPDEPPHKWHCIRNGYDEENFAAAATIPTRRQKPGIKLLHSGLLYPSERDPSCFFQALANLKSRGVVDNGTFTVVLRSTGHDEHHWRLLKDLDILDLVELEPGIPYVEALAEMMESDGLLVFQASNCNNQVPAKIYEYFRARRPILAMTDMVGDTAKTMQELGLESIVPIDNVSSIELGLEQFIVQIREGSEVPYVRAEYERYSRQKQTEEFAHLLNDLLV